MRRFRYGLLTHQNVHRIAEAIEQLLKGKIWLYSHARAWKGTSELMHCDNDVHLDGVLNCDWVDGSRDLIKSDIENEFASIMFSGAGYTHIYTSNKKEPKGLLHGFRAPYFSFDKDRFQVKERLGNDLIVSQYVVLQDLPPDTDDYHEDLLEAHGIVPEPDTR